MNPPSQVPDAQAAPAGADPAGQVVDEAAPQIDPQTVAEIERRAAELKARQRARAARWLARGRR